MLQFRRNRMQLTKVNLLWSRGNCKALEIVINNPMLWINRQRSRKVSWVTMEMRTTMIWTPRQPRICMPRKRQGTSNRQGLQTKAQWYLITLPTLKMDFMETPRKKGSQRIKPSRENLKIQECLLEGSQKTQAINRTSQVHMTIGVLERSQKAPTNCRWWLVLGKPRSLYSALWLTCSVKWDSRTSWSLQPFTSKSSLLTKRMMIDRSSSTQTCKWCSWQWVSCTSSSEPLWSIRVEVTKSSFLWLSSMASSKSM